MHQCLSCSNDCVETAIFCDECRASLLKRQFPSRTEPMIRIFQPAYVSVRRPALLMLGAISLIIGCVLLVVNTLHHHTVSNTDRVAITDTRLALSPQVSSTTWPRETQTPAISPVAGTPVSTGVLPGVNTGSGTDTGIRSTATSGTVTPAPSSTFIPASPTRPNTCTLQATPAHLSFTATFLQPDPPGQSITLKTTGTCAKPVTWAATADASWIQLSSSTGSDNGSGSTLIVYAHSNQIVGTFSAHITFTALDNNGITIPGSPQTISVTLTVIG